MRLLADDVAFYHREGYLSGLRVHDEREANAVRERFDTLEASEGRDTAQIGLLDRHFDQRFVWELAVHPTVLDAVEALIGPDVLLLATHFFCKYGGGNGGKTPFVAWHQDVTYWALEPPEAVTAWYAVDDSDAGNGCMRVIPGSHREGVRPHGKSSREGNLLKVNQEVPLRPGEEESAVDLKLRAGEISLHHGALIHGSVPNRSDRRRCGLTLRYIPAGVRPTGLNSHGKGWSAVLVRGEDRERHFGETAPPFAP